MIMLKKTACYMQAKLGKDAFAAALHAVHCQEAWTAGSQCRR